MKPIKKINIIESEASEKILRSKRIVELCGKCKKTLNKYWKYCAYCGEKIER